MKKKYKHATLGYAIAMHDFDEMCKIENKKMIKKLMNDSLIKRIIKECKEVKRMNRPYFETKVVKVEKEKPFSKLVECGLCGNIHSCTCGKPKLKRKGNWVNGENLDKIKFPCYCRYNAAYIGMITKDGMNYYELHNIEKQADENYLGGSTLIAKTLDLKILIECWHIHILKGKIIIYEEE